VPDRMGIGAWLQRVVIILAGLGSLLLGGWMVAAQLGKARTLPPFAAAESGRRIESLYRDVADFSPEEVASVIRLELALQPVDHRLHYQLGSMLLLTPVGVEGAKAEFQTQLALSRTTRCSRKPRDWPSLPSTPRRR